MEKLLPIFFLLGLIFSVGCIDQSSQGSLGKEIQTIENISKSIEGTIPEEEIGQGQQTTSELEEEFTGLGTLCSTQEECQIYCQTHEQGCEEYCDAHPSNELCLNQQKGHGILGVCSSQEECDVYCSENPLDPRCMEPSEGGPPSQYGDITTPPLSMPFKMEDYHYDEWGLWPFCVHGGDHPEGHGGIDFELDPNTQIVASADGVVEYIEGEEGALHGWGKGVYISHGRIVGEYVCLLNVQVNVGDRVKKGQFLGNPCKTDEGEYFIHYGVNNYVQERIECPLKYLDEEFVSALEEMLSKARYIEKSAEPDICNCEWLPYKETQERGPG